MYAPQADPDQTSLTRFLLCGTARLWHLCIHGPIQAKKYCPRAIAEVKINECYFLLGKRTSGSVRTCEEIPQSKGSEPSTLCLQDAGYQEAAALCLAPLGGYAAPHRGSVKEFLWKVSAMGDWLPLAIFLACKSRTWDGQASWPSEPCPKIFAWLRASSTCHVLHKTGECLRVKIGEIPWCKRGQSLLGGTNES